MNNSKQHLDFIDLAKGMCILFVVSYHVDQCEMLYRNQDVNNFFMSFRIPFYFMLSGLFVSFNSGYLSFILKKVNRLVIPCVFFFFLTVAYSYLFTFLRSKFLASAQGDIFDSGLWNFFVRENVGLDYPNIPIWFLVSLFTTYIIYMMLDAITRKNMYLILALSFVLGVCGYMCSVYRIDIPFYLDSSMTCMPFVAVGSYLRKKTGVLGMNGWKKTFAITLVCLFVTILTFGGDMTFYRNSYDGSIFSLYIAGCFGSISMLLFSKLIGSFPVVNYIGRYSIIVLGTHSFFIGIYTPILVRLTHGEVFLTKLLLMFAVIVSCILCIYLMRRFLPYLVAQKDLISVDTRR